MDNKLKKMFNEALQSLNWEVVLDFYEPSDLHPPKGKKKITKAAIKNELTDLISFMVENNISRFETTQWIIVFKPDCDNMSSLEVIFTPTRSKVTSESDIPEDGGLEEIGVDELGTLQEMLDQSVLDENYELSAVLRDKINGIKGQPVRVSK